MQPQVEPIVYVVDDDATFGEAIQLILDQAGIPVRLFASAEEFLESYALLPAGPSCLVLDMRLRGMSGLSLLSQLRSAEIRAPVIVMTGFGDVTNAVAAMKAGAIDFLEKPLHRQLLLERVRKALDRDVQRCQHLARHNQIEGCLVSLSEREREVMELLVVGDNSKQIAGKLGICAKTAMKHRSHVLKKLGIDSVVHLVRFLETSQV